MLQHVGPKPLIEPEKLKTEADWIEAGRRVFDEGDTIHVRTFDPKFIAAARGSDGFGRRLPPDGISTDLRWVPTKDGVALSVLNCAGCHLKYMADGARIVGAPGIPGPAPSPLVNPLQRASRGVFGASPFHMAPEPISAELYGIWAYQAYGVPWLRDDINEKGKALKEADVITLDRAAVRGGGFPRWNGSLYYAAKIPDLIGIKDRKYIDHTATHL